jgi:hypothetical protein
MPFRVCTLGGQAAYVAVLADLAGRDRGGDAVMIFRVDRSGRGCGRRWSSRSALPTMPLR